MTRGESSRRTVAAVERWQAVEPMAAAAWGLAAFGGLFVRIAVYFCIGFGGASVVHQSLWWGLLGAILSAYTLGNVWEWVNRDRKVASLEAMVDAAIKKANGGAP